MVLEDDPVFNAGRGAALTADGGVELDASVMEGTGRYVGAVACVEGVRNPVRAARAVLRDGHHVLLVGTAARAFAADHGVELCDPAWLVTDEQREVLASGRPRLGGRHGRRGGARRARAGSPPRPRPAARWASAAAASATRR